MTLYVDDCYVLGHKLAIDENNGIQCYGQGKHDGQFVLQHYLQQRNEMSMAGATSPHQEPGEEVQRTCGNIHGMQDTRHFRARCESTRQ
jgi:hypothetical protein